MCFLYNEGHKVAYHWPSSLLAPKLPIKLNVLHWGKRVHAKWLTSTLGILHNTIWRPLVFLISSNKLLDKVGSRTQLSSDDTTVWRFMEDITTLNKYAVDSDLKSWLSKCPAMNIQTYGTQKIYALFWSVTNYPQGARTYKIYWGCSQSN